MSLLQEIIDKLDLLPEAALKELAKQRQATGPVWLPNPGYQTQALLSEADELFFGGQPGGGKSSLLIGTAVTQHTASIIFRREFPQIKGLEDEATRILGSRAGYNGQDHLWRIPGTDRTLEFGSAQHEWSVEKYQGRAHDLKCVAPDTPVLMGDGTYKPIRDVRVGDRVATLRGPRKVTRTHQWWKQAVRVSAWVDGGRLAASQVQGATHRLLTWSGWAAAGSSANASSTRSHADQLASECRSGSVSWPQPHQTMSPLGPALHCGSCAACWASLSSTASAFDQYSHSFVSTAHRCEHRSCRSSRPTYSARKQALAGLSTDPWPQQERARYRGGHRSSSGSFAAWGATSDGSDCGSSACRRGAVSLRSSVIGLRAPCEPSPRSGGLGSSLQRSVHDDDDAHSSSSRPGSPVGCSSGTRHGDARPRPCAEASRSSSRRQADVGLRSPSCLLVDVQDSARIRSRCTWSYAHPYGMGTRQTDLAVRTASLEAASAGLTLLFDLSVDDENHYITAGGFVNQNCFDELTQFSRAQYSYLTLWLRSTKPGQRCRVIATGNPPTTPEGLWVVQYWGPWLDETNPDPAEPGELRWPVRASDTSEDDVELFFRTKEEAVAHLATLKDPPRHPVTGEIEPPKSRTFIPGVLAENPDLLESGYSATLGHASKGLRALAKGEFSSTIEDHPRQVIPTAWIIAAEKRWTPTPPAGIPMTAIGVDPVQGGKDEMVIAPRHDWWFAEPIAIPGEQVPIEAAGSVSAAHIVRVRRDNAVVGVDCGGGYGGPVIERLAGNDISAIPVKGSDAGVGRTNDRLHGFFNKRAELIWRFREALDPDQPGGSPIALPPRPKLRADLAAARCEITPRGIKIEDKDEIKTRIGRSPDWGDAVVIAWALNQANALPWQQKKTIRGSRPTVIVGNAAVKARRRRF